MLLVFKNSIHDYFILNMALITLVIIFIWIIIWVRIFSMRILCNNTNGYYYIVQLFKTNYNNLVKIILNKFWRTNRITYSQENNLFWCSYFSWFLDSSHSDEVYWVEWWRGHSNHLQIKYKIYYVIEYKNWHGVYLFLRDQE